MLVTFGRPILVQFPFNTFFIYRYTCFLLLNFYSVFHHRMSPFVSLIGFGKSLKANEFFSIITKKLIGYMKPICYYMSIL